MAMGWVALLAVATLLLPQTNGDVVHARFRHVQLSPTVTEVGQTGVVYQLHDAPIATLLFFHGCGHSAGDFFPRGPACPHCLGLPEEVAISRASLARGYNVVAFSSVDRYRRCWSRQDADAVRSAFAHLRTSGVLGELPVFGLGASSGGHFVMSLACRFPFVAIAPQIAAMHPAGLAECVQGGRVRVAGASHEGGAGAYPPVAIVHMTRDLYTAHGVELDLEVLKSAGVSFLELPVMPLPLTSNFLSDRVDGIDAATSSKIFEILQSEGFLDEGGFLKSDPRSSSWRAAITRDPTLRGMGLEGDEDELPEELNLAYAMHEITADVMDVVLEFFSSALQRQAALPMAG